MSLSAARLIAVFLLILKVSVAAAAAPVLVVEGLVGEASSERLGERRLLQAGDSIGEREVLHTAAEARLSLRFANEGLLELGPDATLAIEKLPASLQGRDLRSIASLLGGYLHVLWTVPTAETRWPFVIYFGGQRSGLLPGEYFFERHDDAIRSCVASGQLTVTAIAGDGVETLREGACHDLKAGAPVRSQAIGSEMIDAVRAEFTTWPSRDKRPLRPLVLPALAMGPLPGTGPTAARSTVSAVLPPAPAAVVAARAAAPAVVKPVAAPAATTPEAAAAVVAAPQSSPAPVSAVSAAGDVGWTLLIGSFGDPANAEQVQTRLRGIGMEPYVRVKQLDGRSFTSVQVRGGYASREIADAKAAEVRDKLGYPNVRVVYLQ